MNWLIGTDIYTLIHTKLMTNKNLLHKKINKMKFKKKLKNRNEKGEVTTVTADIKRIMREYYKQLYANKMDKLEIGRAHV